MAAVEAVVVVELPAYLVQPALQENERGVEGEETGSAAGRLGLTAVYLKRPSRAASGFSVINVQGPIQRLIHPITAVCVWPLAASRVSI